MKFSFPKSCRLRSSRDYQRALRSSQRKVGRFILLDVSSNSRALSRLGIVASRRFGKSHDRNRFKRIVREAFRLVRNEIPENLDLVVRPRSLAANATTSDILKDLCRLLEKDQ